MGYILPLHILHVTPWANLCSRFCFALSGGSMGYSVRAHHPGVHHREHHRHLDHSGPQAHENRHQLFHRQPGLLWRFYGVLQHAFQLCLCSPQRLVLWPGLLSLSELLPHHGHVFLHILHGGHRCGQVTTTAAPHRLISTSLKWVLLMFP